MRREYGSNGGGYTPLTYITQKNGAVIDTGVCFTGRKLKIEMDFIKNDTVFAGSLFGSSDNNSNFCCVPYFTSGTAIRTALGGGNLTTVYITKGQRTALSIEFNTSTHTYTITVNGVNTTGSWSGSVSHASIYLLCHHYVNGVIQQVTNNIVVYGAKVTVDDVLVRDYSPAMDGNGNVGLLDACGSTCAVTGTSLYVAAGYFE